MMFYDDDKNKILVEIFELTGQKVGPDDPLVAAALFYSACLRRVSFEHQAEVKALAIQLKQDFSQAIESSVASLANVASAERVATHKNFASIIKAAQNVTAREVPGIKRELEKFAESLIRDIRKKATPPAEIEMSLRALLGAVFLAASAGVVAGYFWFFQPNNIDDGSKLTTSPNTGIGQKQLEVRTGPRHAKK